MPNFHEVNSTCMYVSQTAGKFEESYFCCPFFNPITWFIFKYAWVIFLC